MDENDLYRSHIDNVRAEIQSTTEARRGDLLRLLLERLVSTVAGSAIRFPEFLQHAVREWAHRMRDALILGGSVDRESFAGECERLLADYIRIKGEEHSNAVEHILGMLAAIAESREVGTSDTCVKLFRFAIDLAESMEDIEQADFSSELLMREITAQKEILSASSGELVKLLSEPPPIGR